MVTKADDPKPFKVKEAADATARYEKEKKFLDDAYTKALKEVQKTYLTSLTAARKTAIEKNDLDEAQAIVAVIKELEQPNEDKPEIGRFELISAKWGISEKWTDVTNICKARSKSGKLYINPNDYLKLFGEPHANAHKNLIIVYAYRGKVLVEVLVDTQPVALPK